MAAPKTEEPRELSFTERARRSQLIEVTIGLVAEYGYTGTSLARIAQGAGITKAAVLYHYPTKDAVVRAAYNHVLSALATTVAAAVEEVGAQDGPAAYIRTMIGHLREYPEHTRMIVEAMTSQAQEHDPSQRWRGLSTILVGAREARGMASQGDLRTLAIVVGGGIDAIVAERLDDPEYDTAAAAEELVQMTQRTLFA